MEFLAIVKLPAHKTATKFQEKKSGTTLGRTKFGANQTVAGWGAVDLFPSCYRGDWHGNIPLRGQECRRLTSSEQGLRVTAVATDSYGLSSSSGRNTSSDGDGTISPDRLESWEMKRRVRERERECES